MLAVARREASLERLALSMKRGRTFVADITDSDAISATIEAARSNLGEIDIVLCTVGSAVLRPMSSLSIEDWRESFDLNLRGTIDLVAQSQSALSPDGVVALLSTTAVVVPHWGLASYAAAKAGLEAALACWREENPGSRVAVIRLGPTMPTEFGAAFGEDALSEAMPAWISRGVNLKAMRTIDVARSIAEFLGLLVRHPRISIDAFELRAR